MKAPDSQASEAKICRRDEMPPGALPEYASPPCYAHEFPGYFGETEEAGAADEPAEGAPPPCRAQPAD